MDSFSSSIHVRSDDVATVCDAIERVMVETGYDPTDEAPHMVSLWDLLTQVRAVRVSEARSGWVGLLDSNIMLTEMLSAGLSAELETWAISFTVLDSEDWQYYLFQDGELIDYLDTMADQEFDEALAEELFAEFADEHPDMFEEEDTWVETSEGFLGLDEDGVWPEEETETEASEEPHEERQTHGEVLEPLLIETTSPEDVDALLEQRSPVAEDDLREFLPRIGISPAWAGLDYSFYEQLRGDALADDGIRITRHLKFELVDAAEPGGPDLDLI